ncbi:MAG: sulfatase-like hydrolase/transferase [Candidatus Lokiarchaeota archaeon]|nr:sulfatase-like hydrolase/transferase [Candidatus Lokiarchaeota archaeon]
MKLTQRPNILIFIPDEMRGEVITNTSIQMPNVRGLQDDGGIIFTHNFSVNPVCAPSRICTFTGQFPHNGGHRSLYQLLRPREENLFHILKQEGYEVVWIGRNDLFHENSIRESISKRKSVSKHTIIKIIKEGMKKFGIVKIIKAIHKIRKMEYSQNDADKPEIQHLLNTFFGLNPHSTDSKWFNSFYFGKVSSEKAKESIDIDYVNQAVKYLEHYAKTPKKSKKPFCLYIAINNPHPPYQVEEPYFSMYDRSKIRSPYPFSLEEEERKKKPLYANRMHTLYRLNEFSEEELREVLAVYYGMCTKVDHLFGQILKKLKETGLYDSTIINFFADHGDYAGSYGLTEKWPTGMEDALLNVPLVVRVPMMAPKTSVLHALTQTIDVFPTILEIVGIEHPYTHFGKSLLPILKGEKEFHRESIHAEGGYDVREPQAFEIIPQSPSTPGMGIYYIKTKTQRENPTIVCRTAMWRTSRWKLTLRSHPDAIEELYDLENDPGETINLFYNSKYQEIIRELKEDMLQWYIRTSDNPYYQQKREG